jgi:O-antigen/teichoic acid export membrane protein
MASIETTPLLEEKAPAVPAAEARTEGWKPSAIAADIATMGTGTLLAGLLNVALVFVVARLICVEDYGYWRVFMLYAGYVGFFHLGFADGALLRWAGRPLEEIHNEIGPAVKFLFWQHILLLVPTGLMLSLVLPLQVRFIVLALAVFALVMNTVTLLQFALQSARVFQPVAISTVLAPALFLGFAVLWHLRWSSGYREVISFYSLGWLIVLVFLFAWTKPWSGVRSVAAVKGLAKDCVLRGWPILMANTGIGLILGADRLSVSWAATIQNFAQYSLAGSAIAVPVLAIQACSKVFFSHLTRVTSDGRKRIYAISSLSLLLAWTVLLPYYFLLELFLRHFLPKYIPSLEFARVLLLGIPFIAVIQILHMNFAYLGGRQRHFLWRTAGVLALSLGLTLLAAFGLGSLKAVASVQVFVLGCWWLLNEWTLRGLTGGGFAHWVKFASVYGVASLSYWVMTRQGHSVPMSVAIYYGLVAVLIGIMCREEFRFFLGRLEGRHGPAAEG